MANTAKLFIQKYHNYASSTLPKSYRSYLFSLPLIIILLIFIITGYWIMTIGNGSNDSIYYSNLVLEEAFKNPPSVILEDSTINISNEDQTTNSSCTHFNCFDVYKCGFRGDKLLVFVYPPKTFIIKDSKKTITQTTKEFYQILESIVSSRFYTAYPQEACIFIPSIDLLNQNKLNVNGAGQALRSLEFWGSGKNHLIFNMIPGSFPDYNTSIDIPLSKAMIAGAGFSTHSYRTNFDVSIPMFSPLATDYHRKLSRKKTFLLMSAQMNMNLEFEQDLLEIGMSSPNEILLLSACLHHNPISREIRCAGEKVFKYPEILEHSIFCLVMRGARLGQSMLMEALSAGCIPVIVSDSVVMPFEEIIDWKRAAIFIREVDILTIYPTLKNISSTRISQLQQQGDFLWNKYFKSIDKITQTTLEIISDRVFPQLARDYNFWNSPKNLHDNSPLFLPVTAPKTHGFTAVILTYDRVELLFSLITKISQVPSLSKILIIWNNQKKSPPALSKWPKLMKPLQIIRTKENKLSNRFYPYDEIETEAVLSIDDDIIMLTTDELEFAFEVWREFPDRLVGFPSRIHTWDNFTKSWKYESEWTNHISMVLTGAAFYHKYWNYLYSTALPGDIRTWVDNHMNCEDIAMNFLIANFTGKSPIKVTPKKKFRCPECTNTEMLSADLAHMAERSQCINRFSKIYQSMPLQSVEFRADPVLFKDIFPEKLKRFNGIGSL